jgi:hypothetical protein
MSTNVRCAGGGSPRRKVEAPAPCGWKGERLGWLNAYMFPTETMEQLEHRVSTAKPCPRCGGKVEIARRSQP